MDESPNLGFTNEILYSKHIHSCNEKQNLFYQKIKSQRQPLKGPSSIDFAENQKESEGESWASYFFKPASPGNNESFDQQYQ